MPSYNCKPPHSSTGYSPSYLFFGREPKLPVDQLLGQGDENPVLSEDVDEWVADHYVRLKEAFDHASMKIEKEALRRKNYCDRTATDSDLKIGSRVYLKNHVIGRNKIQDTWKNEPYRVVKRTDPNGHVYVVEPLLQEGPPKTINLKRNARCKVFSVR